VDADVDLGHSNYWQLLTTTDNNLQFTNNYRQSLFTYNRQEILKHTDTSWSQSTNHRWIIITDK